MISRSRLALALSLVALLSTSACGTGPAAPAGEPPDGPVGTSQSDLIHIQFLPELVVTPSDTWGSWTGFWVSNQGYGGAGPFRVAVLSGADSYSAYSSGLAVGASQWFGLQFACACEQYVSVIADVDDQVTQSTRSYDVASFYCPCDPNAYNCAVCNDGTCQCNYDTPANLCAPHGGVDPALGCVQEP